MYTRLFSICLLAVLLFSSCEEKDNIDPICTLMMESSDRIFEFENRSNGETFLAWTSNAQTIAQVEAQLALPKSERLQHINGKILRLPESCDANQEWSWYFSPTEWSLAEFSIEVCDATPQYVEENLDEFVDVVGAYCPWSSVVLREVSQ